MVQYVLLGNYYSELRDKNFVPGLVLLFLSQPSCLRTAICRDDSDSHQSAYFVGSEEIIDPLWVVMLMVVGVWLVSYTVYVCLQAMFKKQVESIELIKAFLAILLQENLSKKHSSLAQLGFHHQTVQECMHYLGLS